MYFEDENPPHVHVVGPDFAAKIRITDQAVYAGSLTNKVEKVAVKYVADNMKDLIVLWKKYK
jgi:hypothetical protein